jgi:hypothetical protein
MITSIEKRWAAVVLGGFAGAPGAFRVAEGEVDYVSGMLRFCGAASDKARLGLRIAIVMAMTAPLWMWGRLRSLGSFDATERAQLLDDMLRHRIFFVRELCLLLKLVACMAIFRAEAPRARTTYDPPAKAPHALVVLRTGRAAA